MNKNSLIKLSAFVAAFLLFVAVGIVSFVFTGASYNTMALGTSGISETESGIYITIVKPSGWKTKEARINITYENTQNRNIKSIRVKNGEKGTWVDVSQDPYIVITENSTVYVEIEDRNGYVVSKSRYIEIFDREKPTVKASVKGRLLTVEAIDTISGVRAIYINGDRYDDLNNDTISVTLNKSFGSDISIQAEDNAGNMSQVYTAKNLLNENNVASTRTTAAQEEPAVTTIAPTTVQSTAGQGSTTETSNNNGAAETKENASSGSASTDEKNSNSGSASSNDEIIVGTFEDTDKQFMSVVTKEGQTFYLIVDHDKDSDNVYFLTEITLSDLNTVAAPDDNSNLVNDHSAKSEDNKIDAIDGGMSTEEIELILNGENDADTSSASNSDSSSADSTDKNQNDANSENADMLTEDAENAKEDKPKSPVPGWIVIFILVAVVGFAGYMYFVFLPKKRSKEAFVDDDDAEENYSENYPEYDEDFTDTEDFEDGEINIEEVSEEFDNQEIFENEADE